MNPDDFDTYEAFEDYLHEQTVEKEKDHKPDVLAFQKYLKDKLDISILLYSDVEKLIQLHDDWAKIHEMASKGGTSPVDYQNNYLLRYQSLQRNAEDLCVNISSPPLKSPTEYKTEIAAIYKANNASDSTIHHALDYIARKINLPNTSRLPNKKNIDAHNHFMDMIKNW